MSTIDSTITLGIEMSNPSASEGRTEQAHAIALWSAAPVSAALIASVPLPQGTRGSDGIMHAIGSLCGEHGIRPGDIGTVLVSVGPGGYTALRIATTTAKMLAATLGARLIAVPSALVAARSVGEDQRPALVTLASKREHTHASVIRPDGVCSSIGIITCSVLDGLGVRTIVADEHLPRSFAAAAAELKIERRALRLDARDLLAASAGIEPISPLVLTPIYAREPDAVTQWRSRASQ